MSRVIRHAKALRRTVYALAVLFCAGAAMLVESRYQHQYQVFLGGEKALLTQQGRGLFEKVRTELERHRLQPKLLASLGMSWVGNNCLGETELSSVRDWARLRTEAVHVVTQRVLTRAEVEVETVETPALTGVDGGLRLTSRFTLGRSCDSPWWRVLQTRTNLSATTLDRPASAFSSDMRVHMVVKIGAQTAGSFDLVFQGNRIVLLPVAITPELPWDLAPGQARMVDGRFQLRLVDEHSGLSMAFSSEPLGRGGLGSFVRFNGILLAMLLGLVLALLSLLALLWHTIGLSERLHYLSTRDFLTGLYNRRAAMEQASAELARARRTGRGFCVAQIDIDHFKRINDQFGHDAGDAVLQFFAARLGEVVREQDLLARMGGEEFLVLLPDTDLPGARRMAERLLRTLHATAATYGQEHIAVTCSLGLSQWQGESDSLQGLLTRADRLLYQAKRQGRDRWMDDASNVGTAHPQSRTLQTAE